MPTLTLTSVLGQFPENPPEGDYRILWIGNPAGDARAGVDARAGHRLRDHRRRPADAVRDVAGPAVEDRGRGRRSSCGNSPTESTLRGGRLLAPYAIRYIVVPVADGATSTVDNPLPLPTGLVDALDDQLDFAAPLTRPLNFLVYENTAWIPTRAQFAGADADATRQAGLDSLARLELSGGWPRRSVSAPPTTPTCSFDAQPGAVTVATGVDRRWSLRSAVRPSPPRPAFGVTTGYDIATVGPADAALSHRCVAGLLARRSTAVVADAGLSESAGSTPRRSIVGGVGGSTRPEDPLLSIDAPIVAPVFEVDDSSIVHLDGTMPSNRTTWNRTTWNRTTRNRRGRTRRCRTERR